MPSLLPILLLASVAQTPTQTGGNEPYRIDFKRVFYATPQAEQADRQRFESTLTELEGLKGKLASSPETLFRALTLNEEAVATEGKLTIFYRLGYMVDTRGPGYEKSSALDSELSRRTAFLTIEVAKLPPETEHRFLASEPRLAKFRYVIESAQRQRPHLLGQEAEELMADLSPLATDWASQLHEELRRPTTDQHQNLALRAFSLVTLAQSYNRLAKVRNFSSSVDQFLFDYSLDRPGVQGMLDACAAQRDLYSELTKVNIDHAARSRNLAGVPKFTLSEATQTVEEALAPLGTTYAAELKALYDPRNGRLDVAGGPSRSALGTGWAMPPTTESVLYWPEFTGVYDDLDRGLAHEGGHAIHFQLMRRHGVMPSYTAGPGYFFESFAEFNQLLLADYLYRKEVVPARKAFFLNELLQKTLYPEYLAFYPSLEFAIHEGVLTGKVVKLEDLNAVEQQFLIRFRGPDAKLNPTAPTWSTNDIYFTEPLYNVHHFLGGVLAVAYFQAFKRDPAAFVPKYLALMSNGFDAAPDELLRRFLGIELFNPKVIADSAVLAKKEIGDLRRLYGEIDAALKQ